MSSSRRLERPLSVAACAVLWATVVWLAAEPHAQQTPPAAPPVTHQTPPAAPGQAAGFVGDDTCTTCHEKEGQQLAASLHGKAANPRTPAARPNQSCETCHGPGREHAESGDKTKIRVFSAIAPREGSAVCLTCHSRGNHTQWAGSPHDTRNLSCSTCHSVHSPKSDKSQLKAASVVDTCVTCHKPEVAKQQRVGHMPVREGAMTCTSCHNPHGTTNVKLLRVGNWINETCTSCHAEKRGPFLWDHAPVREACSTCHDPHGSNNDRMLIAKLPMLCQRCHIGTKHPSTIYDAPDLQSRSNRLIGRSCVNCHSQIHGSNSPAGHAFLR